MYCYIHKGDSKRNINTNEIIKTKDLCKQAKLANIDYKNDWRDENWEFIDKVTMEEYIDINTAFRI